MSEKKRPTQRDRVLQFIQEHGSITRLAAATHIGCFELSARIIELESEGHIFRRKRTTVKNRYGDKVSVMEYSLDLRPSLAQGGW